MSTVPSIQTVINVAIISQYKAVQDIKNNNFSGGQVINKTLPNLLRTLRKSIQNTYNINPSDPGLVATSAYLFGLCAPYSQYALGVIANQGGSFPVITGPANQSGLVGFNAVFSVSVTGIGPFVYAWFRNGILVPGATTNTLSVPNAQLTDNGAQFFATVTNSAGQQVSNTATLTVTAGLFGHWYAGGTDYSTLLAAGTDTVAYSGTFTITDGQPLVVPFPAGQIDFIVVQYPISQSVKVHFANPAGGFDQGAVPGLALAENAFGGNNYIYSNGTPFGINNASGQITFS
jgi:hypothetical protein